MCWPGEPPQIPGCDLGGDSVGGFSLSSTDRTRLTRGTRAALGEGKHGTAAFNSKRPVTALTDPSMPRLRNATMVDRA